MAVVRVGDRWYPWRCTLCDWRAGPSTFQPKNHEHECAATMRNATLEEAAKVCDLEAPQSIKAGELAREIRALKKPETAPTVREF